MKNVKSTLVKLFAALALVLATVVTVQAFNANTSTSQTAQAAIKLSKKERLLSTGSQCVNLAVATLLEMVFVTVDIN